MNKKRKDILQFVLIALGLVLINLIGQFSYGRLDLTSEKRYSLNPATLGLLERIEEPLLVKVYLEGDFPAGFQRLQRETRQMLDEFRARNRNIEYIFIDPNEAGEEKDRRNLLQQLQSKGLTPYRLEVQESGSSSSTNVFPGAVLTYGENEIGAQLLIAQLGQPPEGQINTSIQELEFTLANAIRRLVITERPSIAFLEGHGELSARQTADLGKTLSETYITERFNIREFNLDSAKGQTEPSLRDQLLRLNKYDLLIIAKPRTPFTDLDKWLLDQFIMNGGKTIWLLDAVHAEMDSLSENSQFMAYPVLDEVGLTDMLFRYGVRINPNLVQDMVAAGVSDMRSVHPWVYFPLVMPTVEHPITKDLNAIKLEFASSVDTIIAQGVKKTFLLRSSIYSRVSSTPQVVSLATLYNPADERQFRSRLVPLGVLLEGEFTSAFKNRLAPREGSGDKLPALERSRKTQMVVIGDGDVIKNQLNLVNPNIPKGTPLPLGYDQFTGLQYGNKDFLLNTVDYMLDETGLIAVRSRELKMRLLDYNRIRDNRLYWQLLNSVAPVLLVFLFGYLQLFIRKRKYAKKTA